MVEHHQTDQQSLHSAVSAGRDKPSRDGLAVAGHEVPSRTQSARINTLKALLPAGISLLLVFWISSMWLFGSTYKMDQRVNRLKVLVVDLDQGVFGQALLSGVSSLNGANTVPTFVIAANGTTIQEAIDAVWRADYWAAVIAQPGYSLALNNSIASPSGAKTYNAESAYLYISASVRYYTTQQSFVYGPIVAVTNIAGTIVRSFTASINVDRSSLSNDQLAILATPTGLKHMDLAPFSFQPRVLINTVGIVFPILMPFFFNMALNGIAPHAGLYRNTSTRQLLKFKYPAKAIWCLISAISIVAWTVIFKDGWDIEGKNFVALWATMWVFCWINFNTIHAVIVYIPLSFISLIVLPWVIFSVAATIFPLDIQHQIFRVSYALPSHSYWNAAITMYGHGVANKLHIYLPVLAAWLVVTEVLYCFSERTLAKRSRVTQDLETH